MIKQTTRNDLFSGKPLFKIKQKDKRKKTKQIYLIQIFLEQLPELLFYFLTVEEIKQYSNMRANSPCAHD